MAFISVLRANSECPELPPVRSYPVLPYNSPFTMYQSQYSHSIAKTYRPYVHSQDPQNTCFLEDLIIAAHNTYIFQYMCLYCVHTIKCRCKHHPTHHSVTQIWSWYSSQTHPLLPTDYGLLADLSLPSWCVVHRGRHVVVRY